MSFISDRVYDLGLTILDTEANRLDLCSAEPSTYTQATSTFTMGYRVSPIVGAPSARSPNGRKVTIADIYDGLGTATGNPTWWALSDTTNSRLLAAGALPASQVVVAGNVFYLATFDIGIPGV